MAQGQVVGRAVLELLGDSAQFRAEMRRAQSAFERVGSQLESAGRSLTAAVTVPIAAIGVAAGKAAIDFESSFAGIRKTMDLTEAEFRRLAQANRDLAKAIPVSVNELNRIGELAGQLGIRGVQNVLKFEDTIARLAVTTDLTADQAALAFAQIANVIQLPQDQVDRLGAAVVGLGNNFATTESRIVDFAQRIAGAAQIAGISAGAIAGIGTAFASLGVEAEAGGTSIQKVLLSMVTAVEQGGEELVAFAQTAGLTVTEFSDLFRRDAAGAFAAFVEGLGRQGNTAIVTLERLGLQDQRLIRSFLAAAGAGDLLTRAIAQGNREFELNTALVEESAKRFDTAASRLRVFWNQLVDVSITLGDAFVPILTDSLEVLRPLVEALGRVAEAFARLPQPIRLVIVAVLGFTAAVGPALIALGALARAAGTVAAGMAALRIPAITSAFIGWASTIRVLVRNHGLLTTAIAVLRPALGPAGWIAAGVAAIVGVFGLWRRATAEQTQAQAQLNAALQDQNTILAEQRTQSIRAIEARISALRTEAERLKELSARYEEGSRISKEFAEQTSNLELEIFQLQTRLQELLQPVAAVSDTLGNVTIPQIDTGPLEDAGDAARTAVIDLSTLDEWAESFVPKMVGVNEELRQLPVVLGQTGVEAAIAAEEIEQATDRITASQEVLFASLASLGSSIAAFATSGAQSFQQFANAVIRDIARIIAQFLALKAITGILTAINPGLGAGFAEFVGIGGRAHGGPVLANRPYVVGERGPELFVPQSAGNVVAAGSLGGSLTLDTSSLPPYPRVLTPEAAATDDWWRRAFSHLQTDYRDRGGL